MGNKRTIEGGVAVKSRVSPGSTLFQIVLQDFNHRHLPYSNGGFYVSRSGRGIHEVVETIPLLTKLKWAKNGKRAMAWAKKFGSVISCRKVDSHEHRLQMINYLRLETKPIEVDISVDEFTIGRDLEIKPMAKTKKFNVKGA